MACSFSFKHYREMLEAAKKKGFSVVSCKSFNLKVPKPPFLVLRHDVDFSLKNAVEFARIEAGAGVESTFFLRLHSPAYNPFGFKEYAALREIIGLGREVGLHYECRDLAAVTGEDAGALLKKEKRVLEALLGEKVLGCAAHRDFTNINNLDFWKGRKVKDYGFAYEAYGGKFKGPRFVSDSLGKWRGGECLCKVLGKEERVYASMHPVYWRRKASD